MHDTPTPLFITCAPLFTPINDGGTFLLHERIKLINWTSNWTKKFKLSTIVAQKYVLCCDNSVFFSKYFKLFDKSYVQRTYLKFIVMMINFYSKWYHASLTIYAYIQFFV